ncbi:uncharacterized protein LOC110026953 [Phalaenopsis equestris]|uniref:uncharacterized protein LOC110026953 n=1 Tax=Phalaenopsis equestris TaxID=78828 RepID=UPI0009E447EE|nr:uncharacterized protein LOC110026953 [Phalaenopsis equestris]
MIKDTREKESLHKQHGDTNEAKKTCTRLWPPTLGNPRVVRVSQTFGGKDRHSKVSTIRGLRDRRVRLSVPTAIKLYDLQDKLGLNQPSKVVDWLLNVSQNEIEKLPPLPFIPGNLIRFPQSLASSSSSAINDDITENVNNYDHRAPKFNVFSNNAVVDQNVTAQFQKSSAHLNNSDIFLKNRSLRDITMESEIDQKGGVGKYDQLDEIDSTTMAYSFFQQFESNVPQAEVTQGFLFASSGSPSLISLMPAGSQALVPSVFSLYENNHCNFQMPTTFAQLLPLNSSRTSLHADREHERKQ